MSQKKLGMIGYLADRNDLYDGQTIRTKSVYNELIRKGYKISMVDTSNWKKCPLLVFLKVVKVLFSFDNVILIVSIGGRKVLIPLLYGLNIVAKKKIHHIVIGGNLPANVETYPRWVKYLNSFHGNYVQAIKMQEKLSRQGIDNARHFPNFKRLAILSEHDIPIPAKPYKLCTFSRIIKEKGIEEAVAAVKEINESEPGQLYELDIYGKVDAKYEDEFYKLVRAMPEYIRYKGSVPHERSVEVLKNYYLLLFPTYYEGEGFPGTVIDAFSSALPVIASDWRYNAEIIQEKITGRLFPVGDLARLTLILRHYGKHPEEVFVMKKNCLKEAYKYRPEKVIQVLLNEL